MLEASYNELTFKISEYTPGIGAYLYVYKGEVDIYDYLQDSIDICKEQAYEEFGVPLDSWKEI